MIALHCTVNPGILGGPPDTLTAGIFRKALFNAGSLIFQRTLFYGRNVHIPILSVDFQVHSLVVPKISLFESFYPGASDIKHNDLSANTFFQPKLFGGRSFFCPYFEFKLSVSDKCILRELIYAFFMCFGKTELFFTKQGFTLLLQLIVKFNAK